MRQNVKQYVKKFPVEKILNAVWPLFIVIAKYEQVPCEKSDSPFRMTLYLHVSPLRAAF